MGQKVTLDSPITLLVNYEVQNPTSSKLKTYLEKVQLVGYSKEEIRFVLCSWNKIKKQTNKQTYMHQPGTISDSLGLRLFKPFRNKETYCQPHHVPFFLKKSFRFNRKTAFHQISFRGRCNEHCFSPGKFSQIVG